MSKGINIDIDPIVPTPPTPPLPPFVPTPAPIPTAIDRATLEKWRDIALQVVDTAAVLLKNDKLKTLAALARTFLEKDWVIDLILTVAGLLQHIGVTVNGTVRANTGIPLF